MYAIWGALFVTLGTAALYKGMAIGPVSLVAPLSGAYPIVTVILAVAVFNASLSIQQIMGIVLLMSGVFLAAGLLRIIRPGAHPFSRGPLYGLGAAGAWGIGYSLVGQSISRMGWQAATFIELWLIVLFMAILLYVFDRQEVSTKRLQQALRYPSTWWAGITLLIAGLGLNFGLSREMTSGAVITAISACYPAITMVLALRHFKEEVRIVPLLGAIVCIIGVVILSLG
jgi:drug/metabolite transporter (DMT)-like permease